MIRTIITLLLTCCISLPLQAQEIALKNGHPDRHVVVKGDTLWDISGKFLKDPWLWPKVWQLNRSEIKNPHLIYPGDVIVLDMSSGSPRFKLLRETVTLNPNIVIEPLEKDAIPTIALNTIAPFLSQPLIIEKDQLASSPRIVSGQDNRVILSPGTRIYVQGIHEDDGLNWQVYRQAGALTDPDTKSILGYEATYLGDAKLAKYGNPASADITKAKEEIFVKDRLIPVNELLETSFIPHAPESAIKGRIINIYNGVAEAGPGSIVTINRGSADGVEIGHVLAVKSYGRLIKDPEPADKKTSGIKEKIANMFKKEGKTSAVDAPIAPDMIKLPDERMGLLMVFRVFKNVSYALIMQTNLSINKLDAVENP